MIAIRAWGPMFATARKAAPTANRAIVVVRSPVGPMPTTLFLWASEFILPATLPDPKKCLIADLNQAWREVPGASVGRPDIATDQRAPPACRCDILVACPANDGPIVSLAQLRSRMVQHCA